MNDERTDYKSMYENAIHQLEEREEAINMLKKDLQEATARADYFEREKEKKFELFERHDRRFEVCG